MQLLASFYRFKIFQSSTWTWVRARRGRPSLLTPLYNFCTAYFCLSNRLNLPSLYIMPPCICLLNELQTTWLFLIFSSCLIAFSNSAFVILLSCFLFFILIILSIFQLLSTLLTKKHILFLLYIYTVVWGTFTPFGVNP